MPSPVPPISPVADSLSFPVAAFRLPRASALTAPIEVAGVWLASMGIGTGVWAAWGYWKGEDVSAWAADGLALGCVFGMPLTICATIALVLYG